MINKDFEQEYSDLRFQEAARTMWAAALDNKQNSLELLAILRSIEYLHRQIRDNLFQESLPDNRQSLYKLLKDIETRGGWPYIHRMKLRELMENLNYGVIDSPEAASEETATPPSIEL
jgi:hypothetical protein